MRAVRAVEAICFRRQAHLLHHGQAGVRNVQQSVLFTGIHGHPVFAGHRGVYEFDVDIGSHTFDITIAPLFERIGRRGAATLFKGPLVTAARGVRLNFVGGAIHNIDAPAIGLPAGDARREPFIRVGNAPVVLFFEFVFLRVGSRVAP